MGHHSSSWVTAVKGSQISVCRWREQCLHGFIAGNTFGVAKNVTLHAVRVLDCQGKAMLSSLIKVCSGVYSSETCMSVFAA